MKCPDDEILDIQLEDRYTDSSLEKSGPPTFPPIVARGPY